MADTNERMTIELSEIVIQDAVSTVPDGGRLTVEISRYKEALQIILKGEKDGEESYGSLWVEFKDGQPNMIVGHDTGDPDAVLIFTDKGTEVHDNYKGLAHRFNGYNQPEPIDHFNK